VKRKNVIYFLIVISASMLSGCATGSRFPVILPVKQEDESQVSRSKAQDYFLMARDFERHGMMELAEKNYEMAYELDPGSEILKEEVIEKYIESSKFTQALLIVKGDKKVDELSRTDKKLLSTIYLKMGEFSKAADILETLKDKTDEELYSLGLIYESLGNIPKAIKNYLVYLKNNPDASQLGIRIGKVFITERRFDEAESLFVKLSKNSEDDPEITVLLGTVKILKGDTVSGMHLYESALKIDSLNENALRSIAQVYLSRNQLKDAIGCYEKLKNNSESGDVYERTLAVLYYYDHQNEKSEELLNEMLKISPEDFELHYYLGLVFNAQGKGDLASIELEKTVAIRNDFEEGWKELCYNYIREKNYDHANEIADRYTGTMPSSSSSWRLKGYVCSIQKDYDCAIKALKKAAQVDSMDFNTWFELGSAYERKKDLTKASAAFRTVLKLHPDDPSALNYLGYMWAEKGIKLDSAKTMLEKALSKEPENGAFLDSYAWIFYQSGKIDSAYSVMMNAVKKIDDDPVVFSHLGDILYKKKAYKEAIEAYNKSLELNSDESDQIRKKIIDIEAMLQRNRL
jgi:tetratricopeptide (TPR) repeat protein